MRNLYEIFHSSIEAIGDDIVLEEYENHGRRNNGRFRGSVLRRLNELGSQSNVVFNVRTISNGNLYFDWNTKKKTEYRRGL